METSLTSYAAGILLLSFTSLPLLSAEITDQQDVLQELKQEIYQDFRQQLHNQFEELKQRTQQQLQQSASLVLSVRNH